MVTIDKLTVKYNTPSGDLTALRGISLRLARGEICAVIGPSGCGKSTLLHVLSGIVKGYEGQVLINGSPVNPRAQKIGLIPQNYGLLEWETVYGNILLGLRLKRENIKRHREAVEAVVEALGIGGLMDRYPSGLSGGQRQRVSIARAFVMDPDLLLMDEPFSALDAITREEMQELFVRFWKSRRVSTLFVTHSIEEALYIGERIAVFTPAPGRISRVMDNSAFGLQELRFNKLFYDLTLDLRKIVKEEWLA